jgi:hypothetical protein
MNTRVDDYIAGLPEWQQDICREVRRLVHEADPDVEETIKFTNRHICALLGTKDHVNVMLYDKAIVPDPENIITSGHGNKTARMISVYRDQPINGPALVEMFRHIIANNRRRKSVGPRR